LNEGEYEPFEGMVLTDTFQMTEEKGALLSGMFGENSERAKKQNEKPIVAIIGNTPYSAKQQSANDNNQNEKYRIAWAFMISPFILFFVGNDGLCIHKKIGT
jgi:predicted helicase